MLLFFYSYLFLGSLCFQERLGMSFPLTCAETGQRFTCFYNNDALQRM